MTKLIEGDVRAAIVASRGDVTAAARQLGVRRTELWDLIESRPALLTVLHEQGLGMAEDCGQVLRHAIDAGRPWAICFVLRTMGAERGFAAQPAAADEPGGRECEMPVCDFARLTAEQQARVDVLWAKVLTAKARAAARAADRRRKYDQAVAPGVPEALARQAGSLARAADRLGVPTPKLLHYLTQWSEARAEAADEYEELVDDAVSALRAAVSQQEPWAIRFMLQTLGRGRSYGAASQPDENAGLPTPSVTPWKALTGAEMTELNELCELLRSQP